MKIEVFGPGCARCNALAANAKAAVDKLGLDCEIEKVTDITRLVGKGIMMTPALAVDGEVKVSGKVPSAEEIEKMIS
jgi:small redox-active disulfide protein 2